MSIDLRGKKLASDGIDGTKLWDPANGHEMAMLGAALPSNNKWSSGLAFSPDGKSLATGGVADGTIDIWEVTGRREAVLMAGARVRRPPIESHLAIFIETYWDILKTSKLFSF